MTKWLLRSGIHAGLLLAPIHVDSYLAGALRRTPVDAARCLDIAQAHWPAALHDTLRWTRIEIDDDGDDGDVGR